MPNVEQYVIANYRGQSYPIIKVFEDKPDQLIVSFISTRHHLTLHKLTTGQILFTSHSETKETGVWDEERVRIATKLGYRQPERHGQYYTQHILTKLANYPGYFLIGRLIDLDSTKYKKKYHCAPKYYFNVESTPFRAVIHLSTPDNYRSTHGNGAALPTTFGKIIVEPTTRDGSPFNLT